jgi:cell division GTPase FtsZ
VNDRSLDLCAIGLGQAGGFMAAEWRRRGYRAIALHTARADRRALSGRQPGLELAAEEQLDIAIDGAEGAGRDPAFGGRAVRTHADAITAAVKSRLAGADAFVIMAGLGGGTGSAVVDLIDVLLKEDVPIVVVATLPSDGESGIAKVNAARAIDAIVKANIAGCVFVDNGRLLEAFPGTDVVSFFQKVNAKVLGPLDELNRLNAREDHWSLRSFDGEDLRKVLLSSGTLLVHTARLKDGVLAAADLMDVVDKAIDGGEFLARGNSLEQAAYVSVLVAGPEKALKAMPMQVFEELSSELKKKTGGAAVFDGLYVGPDSEPLRCAVLISSLALPKRVAALVESAAREGAQLAKKIARDVAPVDTAVLDGLSLFRGTRGAGSLPPMPSASASTSLPPTSVRPAPRPAPAPVAAPPMQPSSLVLPPTNVREAVRDGPAGPVATTPPKKPTVVTEILPGGSNLPSLPDNLVLPPPNFADDDEPRPTGVTEELTAEGEIPPAGPVPELPSLPAPSGPQAEMEDLVLRYRTGDKKAKERIGRRFLEDSRSPDVQVRMLAVMAMVQVGDGAFRRALTRCSNDDNREIARLAVTGLDALCDVPGVE